MLIQDDARSALPYIMAPGEAALVTLEVTVPGWGAHVLEIDVVHEGYSWFADKGAKACRLRVNTSDAVEETPLAIERERWDDSL